ncbi:hypothetical protein [Bovifimicola ammoniilytica]|jgi:uncharacterized protein YoxC|uniref:hypothetical protein n=1 Tax=Bovifimicola ammoniilytica TaxID=2981720 RepID=UPI0003371060|nr:hypothetical protein [Bovifimicola ammoniilytica]MCU6754646.1 hypothetical protein [Bovifimicola ammoniilytica]CCZ05230.1 putative uncharacterized protein [Eubacterium sp. CAG:603]SCJ88064.1 Uncharacterised protein [uncultured Eubacterium sp.]
MKKNQGVITVEATLTLTAFMFFFMMLYDLLTVCITQAKVAEALNNTAKEFSQYSYIIGVTGLDKSVGQLQENANTKKEDVNNTISNIASLYEATQNVGKDMKGAVANTDTSDLSSIAASVQTMYDSVKSNADQSKEQIDNLKETVSTIAEDPKKFIFGIGQLIMSEGLEIFKSQLIVDPLARGMMKKHLMTSKGQSNEDLEQILQGMRIVPGSRFGKTSYINGIDFSHSTLFPYGSDEITIVAEYKIKIIPLLPVNLEYSVKQKASTKGWLHGDGQVLKVDESSGKSTVKDESTPTQYTNTDSVWNGTDPTEINKLIRNMGISDYKTQGYENLSGSTYAQLYNSETNTFVMISSSNPLYGEVNLETLKSEETKKYIKNQIEKLTSGIVSSCENQSKVTIKRIGDGGTEKVTYDSGKNKSYILDLVIPQDEGVKELYEEIIKDCKTHGVTVKLTSSYGCALQEDT